MMGFEYDLASLLYEIFAGENAVENSRQFLCANPDFNPYSAFDLLDRFNKSIINEFDLKHFVAKFGVECDNTRLVIQQYDSSDHAQLSISDFFQFILPSDSLDIRERALARRGRAEIPFTLQLAFAKHIQLESQLQVHWKSIKEQITLYPQFSMKNAFFSIDRERHHSIGAVQMKKFMKLYGFDLLLSNIDLIIRRLDTDGDGYLSFIEFCEGISPNHAFLSEAVEIYDSSFFTIDAFKNNFSQNSIEKDSESNGRFGKNDKSRIIRKTSKLYTKT